MDLKSAFDLVDREALWLLLCRLGVVEKTVDDDDLLGLAASGWITMHKCIHTVKEN